MELNLVDIKEKLPESDRIKLEYFLAENVFSENQLIQILKRTFKLNNSDDLVSLKTGIGKLLFLFEIASGICNKEHDPVSHSGLILRLMSENGEEAFNELLCHFGLNQAFSTYGIYPLFSDAPDGRIGLEEASINVEIKSRFSQFVMRLNHFYSQLTNIFPCLETSDLECQILINKVDKKISDQELHTELLYLQKLVAEGNFCEYSEKRNTDSIEYELNITCSKSSGSSIVYFTEANIKDCIYSSKIAQNLGYGKTSGQTQITVVLADQVKEVYSSSIIKDCLDRIKNMPDEPRCIVIYSNILGNEELKTFFKTVAETYVKRKTGTAVIGVFGHFLERTSENGVGLNKFAIGETVSNLLEQNLRNSVSLK